MAKRRRRRNQNDRDIDSAWQRRAAQREAQRNTFATVGAIAGAAMAASAAATLLCDSPRGPVARTAGGSLLGIAGAFGGAILGYALS